MAPDFELNNRLERFLIAKRFQQAGSERIADRILEDAGFFDDLNTLLALEDYLATAQKIAREQQKFIAEAKRKNGRR